MEIILIFQIGMSEGPGWWSLWSIFVGSFLKTHDEDSDHMGWMTMSISYHVTWPWLIDYGFFQKFLIYRLTRPMILFTTFQPKSVGLCLAKKNATMTTGNMATSEVHGSSQERLCGTGCLATWRIDRWNPRDLLGCCFITPFLGYT